MAHEGLGCGERGKVRVGGVEGLEELFNFLVSRFLRNIVH